MDFFLIEGRKGIHLVADISGYQAIPDNTYDEGCKFGQGLTAEEAVEDLLSILDE